MTTNVSHDRFEQLYRDLDEIKQQVMYTDADQYIRATELQASLLKEASVKRDDVLDHQHVIKALTEALRLLGTYDPVALRELVDKMKEVRR